MEENKSTQVATTNEATGLSTDSVVQYIVVKIGSEQYGINIKYVDNIVRMQNITRVPKAQTYYRGVINLRGEIVPVMSLRLRLGLEADQFSNKTRIIIVKLENATIGIIVDEVREVVNLTEEDVERTGYEQNTDVNKTNYISAVGKSNNELISLLDVSAVINEKVEG
ncbi:MAG: chemotaxis protein CheW [Lachnospiraceae bacterium]|nr:chemotaxis protein CheW [Lachnospiraceae bacterium]